MSTVLCAMSFAITDFYQILLCEYILTAPKDLKNNLVTQHFGASKQKQDIFLNLSSDFYLIILQILELKTKCNFMTFFLKFYIKILPMEL